ncbi:hypothetical protein ACLOJK_020840 [Asimina triloba]
MPLIILATTAYLSNAGDPAITSDFMLSTNVTAPNSNFFSFTSFRVLVGADPPTEFKVMKASAAEFPALGGQSTLQAGDMFVFPKGLIHYQYNPAGKDSALAVSAFGSANAGTVSVPANVFATGIDEAILAKSFKTDIATVKKLKAGLVPKP